MGQGFSFIYLFFVICFIYLLLWSLLLLLFALFLLTVLHIFLVIFLITCSNKGQDIHNKSYFFEHLPGARYSDRISVLWTHLELYHCLDLFEGEALHSTASLHAWEQQQIHWGRKYGFGSPHGPLERMWMLHYTQLRTLHFLLGKCLRGILIRFQARPAWKDAHYNIIWSARFYIWLCPNMRKLCG